MKCNITEKGNSELKIATSTLGVEVASAMKVKYSDTNNNFDGFPITSITELKGDDKVKAFSHMHSVGFTEAFGYWTEPLTEKESKEAHKLLDNFNARLYPDINNMTLSLPTKLSIYKGIQEGLKKGEVLSYLDEYNHTSSTPKGVREITPILIDENLNVKTVYGQIINNMKEYKLIDHKIQDKLPLIESDFIGTFVNTNTGKIRLTTEVIPLNKITELGIKSVYDRNNQIEYNKNDALRVKAKLEETFAKQGIKVTLEENAELAGIANVEQVEQGKFKITYNPLHYKGDSIYHEHGHIYVDLLEDQNFIRAGIEQVKGTETWNRVAEAYPQLAGEALGREVLVTVIGEVAEELEKTGEIKHPSKFWVLSFFQRIAKLFGVNVNVAESIARDLIAGNITRKLDNRAEMEKQWQKDIDLTSGFKIATEFMQEKRKQLKVIIRRNKSNIDRAMYTATAEEMEKKLKAQIDNVNSLEDGTLLETMLKLTDHDVKMLRESEDTIDKLNHKFDNIGDLTKLTNQEVIDNINQVQNILVELNGFMHITNLGTFSNQILNSLFNIDSTKDIVDYEIKEGLDMEQKLIADVILKLENVRTNMASRVNTAKVRADRLSKVAMASVIAQSSNPDIARKAVTMLENGLVDENWFQKYFMNNFDSSNSLVANIGKVEKRVMTEMKHENNRRLRKFEKVYADTTPEMIKSLTLNNEGKATRHFVTKYDTETFYADWHKKVKGISKEGRKSIHSEMLERTYTDDEITKIIEDKRKELGETDKFHRWIYDNFEIEDGKPVPKLLGDYALPKASKYISQRYMDIMSNPNTKEYELLNYFLNELKELTAHQVGLVQYHGGLPIIDAKKSKSKNGEAKLLYDEFGNKIHTIRFRNVGDTFKDAVIKYPEFDPKIESKAEWEAKTVDYVNNRYGHDFTDIQDVYKHNLDVQHGSKKLLNEALSYDMSTVFPAFIKTSLEHKFQTEVERMSLLAISQMEKSKFEYRNNANRTVDNIADRNEDGTLNKTMINGKDTNVLARFKKDREMKLYGEFIKDNKSNKVLQEMRNYVALVGLGFNVQAAAKNLGMGEVQLRLEARAGIQFDMDDYKLAKNEYLKYLSSFYKDKHTATASNEISGFLKHFEVLDDYTEIIEQSHDLNLQRQGDDEVTLLKNKYTKKLNKMAFGLTNIVEHALHNKTLLAMMHSHRIITDENGVNHIISRHDYVKSKTTKEYSYGKLTDKVYAKKFVESAKKAKAEAESTFENDTKDFKSMFEFKDGFISIKNDENGKPLITKEEVADFELKVQGVNHKMHGIYNRDDKGIVEHPMMGQLFMQFKHWLPAMWADRFGTSGNPFNTATTWNERRQEESIGNYNAVWKMIGKSTQFQISKLRDFEGDINPIDAVKGFTIGVMKFIANARVYYWTMNSYEQASLMKAVNEMLYAAGIFATVLAASAAVPDDDKDTAFYNFPMYVLKGVNQELTGLAPVFGWTGQVLNMTKNPTATFGYTIDVMKLLARAGSFPFRDESNYFQSGRKKGRAKVLDSVLRLTPGVTQWNKFQRFFENDDNSVYSMFSY